VILNWAPRSGQSSSATVIQHTIARVGLNLWMDRFKPLTPHRYQPGIGSTPRWAGASRSGPQRCGTATAPHKSLPEALEDALLAPYHTSDKMIPCYYQQSAINRTIEVLLKGQRWVRLTLATGTGKTVITFQNPAFLR
jgi:hypothetical protein